MPAHGKSRQRNSIIPLESLKERYGNTDNLLKIYLDICKCISGRSNQVSWKDYSAGDWKLFKDVAIKEGVAAIINSKKSEKTSI